MNQPLRVLVVEDDALLAMDLAQNLSAAGLEVVGPATSVSRALALIRNNAFDVAVIDVNLGRETAEPIALTLRQLGTPFIVLSGYSNEQQPPAFQGARVMSKPVSPTALIAAIRQCSPKPPQ